MLATRGLVSLLVSAYLLVPINQILNLLLLPLLLFLLFGILLLALPLFTGRFDKTGIQRVLNRRLVAITATLGRRITVGRLTGFGFLFLGADFRFGTRCLTRTGLRDQLCPAIIRPSRFHLGLQLRRDKGG